MDYKIEDIAVFILTYPKNIKLAKAISETWGRRIPTLHYMSQDIPNVKEYEKKAGIKGVVTIPFDRHFGDPLGEKVVQVWKWAYDHYGDSKKWFLCIDDDSYLFAENLLECISQYDYKQALYLGECSGRIQKELGVTHIHGGPGILLSHGGMDALGKYINHQFSANRGKTWIPSWPGDMVTAYLLHHLKIFPTHVNGFIEYPRGYFFFKKKHKKHNSISISGVCSEIIIHLKNIVRNIIKESSLYARYKKYIQSIITKEAPKIVSEKILNQFIENNKSLISMHKQSEESMYKIEEKYYHNKLKI